MPRKKKEDSSTAVSKPKARKKPAAPKAKAPKTPVKKTVRKTAPKVSPALKVKAQKTTASKAPKEIKLSSPAAPAKNGRLPRQGQTQMVVFIRDPHCLFTYWEIAKEVLEAAQAKLGPEFGASTRILKIFKEGPEGEEIPLMEIGVGIDEMNRYVQLDEAGGCYFLEVGHKTPSGGYVALVRSNKVATSTGTFSNKVDPHWETPDGLLEYYEEEGLQSPEGLQDSVHSSASLGSRRKGRHSASSF